MNDIKSHAGIWKTLDNCLAKVFGKGVKFLKFIGDLC